MSTSISWFIKENDDYIQDEDYYLGSFNTSSEINIIVQVWNNRYGSFDVDSIDNANLVLTFENIEDSILFNYCNVTINDSSVYTSSDNLNRFIIPIGELSGQANNGLSINDNASNYKDIKISFSNLPINLKKDLKNLFLDIEYI